MRIIPSALYLTGVLCVCSTLSSSAQEVFLESFWQDTIPSLSVAIWAGGNQSQALSGYTAPHSANGIYLDESAIGQLTPQSLGYPGAESVLTNLANAAITSAQGYHYSNHLGTTYIVPHLAWSIVFTGGFNPADGSIYGTGVATNYFSSMLDDAEYYLRASLRINPLDEAVAGQLILLAEARMIPLEWSGTEALAFATKARLLGLPPVNGSNAETLAIEQARGYFREACDILSQYLGNPADANLMEGLSPIGPTAVTNEVAEVVDDYLRNLAEYAQASLSDFKIRSLAQFYDPAQQSQVPPSGLLNDIDSTYREIALRLLLVSPFHDQEGGMDIPPYTAAAAGQVESLLDEIGRLHESILLGRITFLAGGNGYSTDPAYIPLFYGEYSSSFIPIFSGLQYTGNGNSSFDVAYGQAESFLSWASGLESTASNYISAAQQLAYDYTSSQTSLQQQYVTQLINLCGSADTNGDPDIFFAALPPGTREAIGTQILTNYNIIQYGTIYQQWLTLRQAETNLLLATLQLSNTFATMLVKAEVADAIYSNQIRLANLTLSDGQQIAALDVQKGEVQAQGDLALAQIQHDSAEEQGNNALLGTALTFLGDAALAYSSGGLSLLATPGLLGGALTQATDSQDQAAAALKTGDVQANTARQLADFDAQVQQLSASEQAEMQYAQADATMLNLTADLNALRLQADSQRVQISLAAQAVDQERTKLGTLIGQVADLLRQFSRSVSLLAANPQWSDNLLIARDSNIQRADDAFVLAQQWAFLAAQAFSYKFYCPGRDSDAYVRPILAARRVVDLQANLMAMNSAASAANFGCLNSPTFYTAHVSLRNDVFQANRYNGQDTNTLISAYEPVLQNGTPTTNAAASYAAWTNFLASKIVTNITGSRQLRLVFSTLDLNNHINPSPLFAGCDKFGATIFAGNANNTYFKGLQVSLTTQGFQLQPGNQSFIVELTQSGTSLIRGQGYANPNNTTPTFKCFNFDYYTATVVAGANNLTGSPGTANFAERSPANTEWVLTITEGDLGNLNNTALLNHIDQLADIEILFSIRIFVDQIASQICNPPL